MADEKKFYWLKLKREFFKRHDIQIIENMPNGKDYVIFYLKLMCESIDHEGRLRFSDTIPYNEEMLSTITNTNVDIVRSALKIFVELGMIEILDDKTIFMTEVLKLIGSETKWAEYKRNKKLENFQLVSKKVQQEKDIDIEKELDIELEIYNTTTTTYTHEDLELKDQIVQGKNNMACLFISNAQVLSLRQKLTENELDHYLAKMTRMLADNYEFGCSHYKFILDMAIADKKIT